MEVFQKNPGPVFENRGQGAVRLKREADRSRIAQTAIYWGT